MKSKKNYSWLVCLGALIGFIIILALFYQGKLGNFDNNIYNFIIKSKSDLLTNLFKLISDLCDKVFIVIIMLSFFIFNKNKKDDLMLLLVTGGSYVINFVVKHLVKRPRPMGIALVTETSYSFPSSHAMVSMAMYGFIIYLVNTSHLKKNVKIILNIGLSLLILLIDISRIYLGAHFASDVLAGSLLGLCFLICFINLIYKKYITKK
jgi:undecaprenyl-diphosphatase